jgi:hypothetical protein
MLFVVKVPLLFMIIELLKGGEISDRMDKT